MNPAALPMEISLDPIIYFYTHSLLVIALSAVVFMAMGIWIGHITWAKFSRIARAYQEECDLLRHEIAALKRRIGEKTAGPAPLVLITEDAPVPDKALEIEPVLPGLEGLLTNPVAQVLATPTTAAPAAGEVAPVEPPHESLASVVIGPAGAAHHTLEPVAPPDSIADFAMPPAPAINGKHPAPVEAPAGGDPVAATTEAPAKPRRHKKTDAAKSLLPTPPVDEPSRLHPPEVKPQQSPFISAQEAFATELAEGSAFTDPALGVVLKVQPERWDDLTLLRGVGEVLQQRLHDQGVHTFKQIAYWTEANVEAVSAKIEARDRIHREQWVDQARDMHFLKYGEKLA